MNMNYEYFKLNAILKKLYPPRLRPKCEPILVFHSVIQFCSGHLCDPLAPS